MNADPNRIDDEEVDQLLAEQRRARIVRQRNAVLIVLAFRGTGGGATAVRDLLSPAGGAGTDVSVLGAVLVVIAVLSFSRAMQRLFEQAWELKPLSVPYLQSRVRRT